jgi:hypothetical protein
MAVRGCGKFAVTAGTIVRGALSLAEASFCNASLFIGSRYCCNEDYCNGARMNMAADRPMIGLLLVAMAYYYWV